MFQLKHADTGSMLVVVVLTDVVVVGEIVVVTTVLVDGPAAGTVVVETPVIVVVEGPDATVVVAMLVVGLVVVGLFATIEVVTGGSSLTAVVVDCSGFIATIVPPTALAAPAVAAIVPTPTPPPTPEVAPVEAINPAMPAAENPGGNADAPACVAPTMIPGFSPGNIAAAGSRSHSSETIGSCSSVRAPLNVTFTASR
jgi:hypothetical protein